jgi:hypothetical protein
MVDGVGAHLLANGPVSSRYASVSEVALLRALHRHWFRLLAAAGDTAEAVDHRAFTHELASAAIRRPVLLIQIRVHGVASVKR